MLTNLSNRRCNWGELYLCGISTSPTYASLASGYKTGAEKPNNFDNYILEPPLKLRTYSYSVLLRWIIKNPFSRHTAPKKSVVSRQTERGLEREVKKLEELDEATRKLYKDGKRYTEACNAVAKAEHKLVQDLVNSGLSQNEEQYLHNVEAWDRDLDELDRHRLELNTNIQKTLVEPMKKFTGVFPSVQSAVKKRDQSLQDYNRSQAKYNKYQDSDRTGKNVVKLDTNKKALEVAKDEFTNQDLCLRQDLPRLYEGRIDYFKPTFDALVRSQLTYSTEAFRVYSEVASEMFQNSKLTEQERKSRMTQTLAELKALSITVDD